MLVPEAPVNHDHFSPGWEYDVGRAWKLFAVEAIPVAHPMYEAAHAHLRASVPPFDPSHMLA